MPFENKKHECDASHSCFLCLETEQQTCRHGFELWSEVCVEYIAGRVFEIQSKETEVEFCFQINSHRCDVYLLLLLLERLSVQAVACLDVSAGVEVYNRADSHADVFVELVSIHERECEVECPYA